MWQVEELAEDAEKQGHPSILGVVQATGSVLYPLGPLWIRLFILKQSPVGPVGLRCQSLSKDGSL